MATLKEIQIRLKSVKNIGKITKSMKMIASTKLVRAQKAMDSARAFGNTSNAVFKHIGLENSAAPDSGTKTLLVACSSDRGLCGAIHSTISKPAKKFIQQNPDATSVVVLGDKARSQIARTAPKNIALSFSALGKAVPSYSEAASATDLILGSDIKFDKADIYYNSFKSVISYELDIKPAFNKDAIEAAEKLSQYEIEDDILENFAEFTFCNSLFSSLGEGYASEMAARRTAMENATKNADDMVDSLTMTYNRSRQASITNDLVDIITGAAAL